MSESRFTEEEITHMFYGLIGLIVVGLIVGLIWMQAAINQKNNEGILGPNNCVTTSTDDNSIITETCGNTVTIIHSDGGTTTIP